MEREILKNHNPEGGIKIDRGKNSEKERKREMRSKNRGGRGEIFIHILNLHSFYMWIVNFTHGSKKSQSGSKFQKNCDPDGHLSEKSHSGSAGQKNSKSRSVTMVTTKQW